MNRVEMVHTVGDNFNTCNIEAGEWSYVKAAGGRSALSQKLGYDPKHYKLDIRFEDNGVAVLVETKQSFCDADEAQIAEYLAEELALNPDMKCVCVLADTTSDRVRVWKGSVDKEHLLEGESRLRSMAHYEALFQVSRQNNREAVLRNTYKLNETLHRKGIKESLRSQFVGSVLLYVKDIVGKHGYTSISESVLADLRAYWSMLSASQIRDGINETFEGLLSDSDNKDLKVKLLKQAVIQDQQVRALGTTDWVELLVEITGNIFRFINTDSAEGQDILNLFFVAFNKYTGKADKNQAFTPDHITHFMCRVAGVDRTKRVFDGTCGSGSFLVQAMVLELADVAKLEDVTEEERTRLRRSIAREHVFGVEVDEKAFGLATTNMLIHGDGNSNIIRADLFKSRGFFQKARPDVLLMNVPFNARPLDIPAGYKEGWNATAKEDPTKGMVFLKFLSDCLAEENRERLRDGKARREVTCAIILPVSAAIGNSNVLRRMKASLLADNTLEAVFTLPDEVFNPGASVAVCCMVFTMGRPHVDVQTGRARPTFFGYCKDDGHKKRKGLGRIEQFGPDNESLWKPIETEWLELYKMKEAKDGLSALAVVGPEDEWLCEAYMKTDYSKLTEADFQRTVNDYLAYLVKEGKVYAA